MLHPMRWAMKTDKSVTVYSCVKISGFAIANQIQMITESSHDLEDKYLSEHDARTEDGKWADTLEQCNSQEADVHGDSHAQSE